MRRIFYSRPYYLGTTVFWFSSYVFLTYLPSKTMITAGGPYAIEPFRTAYASVQLLLAVLNIAIIFKANRHLRLLTLIGNVTISCASLTLTFYISVIVNADYARTVLWLYFTLIQFLILWQYTHIRPEKEVIAETLGRLGLIEEEEHAD